MRCRYYYRKIAKSLANSGDSDQMHRSATSDLGPHCLQITLSGVSSLQWAKQLCISQTRMVRSYRKKQNKKKNTINLHIFVWIHFRCPFLNCVISIKCVIMNHVIKMFL